MFSANNYVIDKVRRVTQINLATGMVDFTGTSIENPQIEFTGDSVDKTDAQGVLLARFDTAKGVNFSGELSVLSMPMMAAQLGAEVQIATSSKKVTGEDFEVVNVVSGAATLSNTPTVAPTHVYPLTEDKNIDLSNVIQIGTGSEKATITGKVITMPASFTGTKVGVYYKYETDSAVKLSDSSEGYADSAKYIIDVLAADVCNPAIKRAGKVVFPKAKINNNFTVNLTTEGTHPFSFSALRDYCSDEDELCYLLFHE